MRCTCIKVCMQAMQHIEQKAHVMFQREGRVVAEVLLRGCCSVRLTFAVISSYQFQSEQSIDFAELLICLQGKGSCSQSSSKGSLPVTDCSTLEPRARSCMFTLVDSSGCLHRGFTAAAFAAAFALVLHQSMVKVLAAARTQRHATNRLSLVVENH